MDCPSEFLRNYAATGARKAGASAGRLFLLAMLAGFLIGMGAAVSSTAAHALENPSTARLVSGLLFPFGLIIVVLTGAELFTGNCLITISVLERRTGLARMLRSMGIVYVGNLTGAVSLASAMVLSGQMDLSGGGLAVYAIRTAAAKCSLPFGGAVLLGVLCNVLVCAGVMCALCGRDAAGRAVGAFLPVCFFVICGFEHCVANMYYIPAGLLALGVPRYTQLVQDAGLDLSGLSWHGFFLQNLLPVTLGNLLGGCGFAALIWTAYRDPPSAQHSGAARRAHMDGVLPPDEGACRGHVAVLISTAAEREQIPAVHGNHKEETQS